MLAHSWGTAARAAAAYGDHFMDLLLIRHAEPVRIAESEGPADPPLSPRGVMQADRLAVWLADEQLDAMWSSPMRRAQETAAPVARHHGLDVVSDDELAEFDREATSYIPYEELRATNDPRYQAMVTNKLHEMEVDGPAFQQGVVAAFERVIAANPSRTVAVTCHGGVVNAYLAHILGINRLLWFAPDYTSISRVTANRSGMRTVVSVNETAHLRGSGLL